MFLHTDPAVIAALGGAIAAILPAIGVFIVMMVKLWRRDDHTDKRVDLLWQAHFRRGTVEGINQNWIQRQPDSGAPDMLVLNNMVRKAFLPLTFALRDLRKSNPALHGSKLAEEIERVYGEWLVKHICMVLGVDNFGCLSMAVMIAEEDQTFVVHAKDSKQGESDVQQDHS